MSTRRSATAPRRTRRTTTALSDDDDGGQAPEDVETEPRERKSLKKAKPSKRAPSRRGSDNDEDEDEDDIPSIDVDNFTDQPLQRESAVKLNGVLNDWQSIESLLTKTDRNPFSVVTAAAEAVTEYGEDEAQPIIDQLDVIMRELIDASVQMDLQRNVMQDLKQRIHANEEIADIISQWEKGVKVQNTAYIKKTSRQKYAKDARYHKFKESIWNIQHERDGKAMPPLSSFVDKEEGDEDDSDDDVEVGGATQAFNDPLTMTIITDPVTSRTCNHSYSKASMHDFLLRGPQRCPHLGCNKMISSADLIPDPELARKIKAFQRREQRRNAEQHSEEEIDDDDVIE